MVSLKRATTSCVVQKEKTQTRITFNNLSSTLTVTDLYKYVQLHLEEQRPFELSLVQVVGDTNSAPLKVSLQDKKDKTLLAAGLCFSDGAANTVMLISSATAELKNNHSNGDLPSPPKPSTNGVNSALPEPTAIEQTMGVPVDTSETVDSTKDTSNGVSNGHTKAAENGQAKALPTEDLDDFSRQITITTRNGDTDDDPAPQVSPLETDSPDKTTVPDPPPLPALEYPSASASSSGYGTRMVRIETSPSPYRFVGLVNQAMTCYLNSLLQALYMTPEFRNALYNWEFDGQDESKSIPYQLQRLFLNLQTSPKSAVETTDLTRSFGWDSSEAWQQHDIQELCRVMFDALEHKFKNTKESNLINRLYEGKMIDYLKCLSCGTERQREDTFLDIPLPVKPFGSSVAFESIEEALRAFIQPEILNGNNQYSCEKCDKKCDAHKGLKFSKFPYILTLHLKRFDFDYQTFHRIKLNDKVTFPQTLNLNGFVNTATDFEHTNGDSPSVGATNGNGHPVPSANGQQQQHSPMEVDGGSDEGEQTSEATSSAEEEKSTFGSASGPYMYELFAIMIHSGSASGGHYYVYIKDFDSSNWFCFNDQSVSPITQEDIQKSFGGNAGRYHYSGAYTTSTNAYMLMYRQMDPERNKLATKEAELPEHIQALQKRLKDRQEVDNRRRNTTDSCVITTRVYHYDRQRCKLSDVKIHISGDYYLDELLQRAYDRMSLATRRSLNLCRLVAFDSRTEQILGEVGHHDQTLLQDVLDKYERCDFLLEERDRDEQFGDYTQGPMLNARVYLVDLKSSDVNGPHRVPVRLSGTVADMKNVLRSSLKNSCVGELRVAVAKGNLAVVLENDSDVLEHEIDPSELCPVRLFVTAFPDSVQNRVAAFDGRFKKIVERFDRIVSLYLKVPKIDSVVRKLHSIPDYIDESPVKAEEELVVPPVVVKVEPPPPPAIDGPEGIRNEVDTNVKALSPTPDTNTISTSSPSPEPHETSTSSKEESPAPVVKPKKKILVPKSKETKEKSPVRIVESTKEVIDENGVVKRVRVVKRIVKKVPSKAAVPENGDSVAPVEDKGTVLDKPKVVKKVKSAAAAPKKELVDQSKEVPVAATSIEDSVVSPVVDKEIKTNGVVEEVKPEPILVVDQYSFLDSPTHMDTVSSVPYFRAIPVVKSISEQNGSIADDEMHMIQLHVDKSMNINALKSCLESILKVAKDYFKVNRSRTETLRLSELVSQLGDGEEFFIELGRILQDGEYKYRVSYMKLSEITDYTEELQHLCDIIVRNDQRVDEVKRGILDQLGQTDSSVNGTGGRVPEKCRLWTKLYQSLGQACTDNSVLGEEIMLRKNGEFVLEETDVAFEDPMTDCDDFVIFVRKWNPDTLVLEPYQSLTLPLKSELMARISEKSGIPVENLEYVRHMSPFPKMKISKVNINGDMDWKSEPIRTSFDASRSGHVYFYRDKTVAHKELSTDEAAAIQAEESRQRETARAALGGSSNGEASGGAGDNLTAASTSTENGSSSYNAAATKNRRKERALKIYLDSSVTS